MASNLNILGRRIAELDSYNATHITELIALIGNMDIAVQKLRFSVKHKGPKHEKTKDEMVDKLQEVCSRLGTHCRETTAFLIEITHYMEVVMLEEKQRGVASNEDVAHSEGSSLERTHPSSLNHSEPNDIFSSTQINHDYVQSEDNTASRSPGNLEPNSHLPTQSYFQPSVFSIKPQTQNSSGGRSPSHNSLQEEARVNRLSQFNQNQKPNVKGKERENPEMDATEQNVVRRQPNEIERGEGSHRPHSIDGPSPRSPTPTTNYQRPSVEDFQHCLYPSECSCGNSDVSESFPAMDVEGLWPYYPRGELFADEDMIPWYPQGRTLLQRIYGQHLISPIGFDQYPRTPETFWIPGAVWNDRESGGDIPSGASRFSRSRSSLYW